MNDFGRIKFGVRGKDESVKPRRWRGRPRGSKNVNERLAPGCDVPGAATSASKMNRTVGTKGRAPNWLWVPGEGWVEWKVLAEDVERAFESWRRRKAVEGVKIFDAAEARAADIAECLARRSAA